MKFLLSSFVFSGLFAFSSVAHAQSTVIYQDDFEGSVTGWSVNDTDYDDDTTNFLGRFANPQTTTTRTFSVPTGSNPLTINFDLYKFDSWDTHAGDGFELTVDGTSVFFTFGAPNASGTSNNIDWSYTRTRGPEHFAFNPGTDPWWREEIFEFEVIVNNPGTAVALTLKGNLNQNENDESIGYDNFLVTVPSTTNVITAVPESFPVVNGAAASVTTSVLASDTLSGAAVNPADVTLTVGASDPELTLDPTTGFITVAAGTLTGAYTVEYTICENLDPTNCATVVETVNVVTPSAELSITKTNTLGVNGNVDQASDTLISGSTTTYTVIVTNNGPDSVTGAIVTDVIGTGLTCAGANAVTISGSGGPSGSFTIADLIGAGITLGNLADTESTTLTYDCTVN